jgi:hypothetical protein
VADEEGICVGEGSVEKSEDLNLSCSKDMRREIYYGSTVGVMICYERDDA